MGAGFGVWPPIGSPLVDSDPVVASSVDGPIVLVGLIDFWAATPSEVGRRYRAWSGVTGEPVLAVDWGGPGQDLTLALAGTPPVFLGGARLEHGEGARVAVSLAGAVLWTSEIPDNPFSPIAWCFADHWAVDGEVSWLADCNDVLSGATGASLAQTDGCTVDPEEVWAFHAVRLVDLDLDGTPELVAPHGVFEIDGAPIVCHDGPTGAATILQADDDPGPELLVVGRDEVVVRSLSGEVLSPQWPVAVPVPHHGHPAIADLDGDGLSDLVLSGGGGVALLSADGILQWQTQVSQADSSLAWTAPVIVDLFADGAPEIVVRTSTGLVVLDATTGRGLTWTDAPTWGWGTSPIWADVDGDRVPEILVADGSEAILQRWDHPGEPPRERSLQWNGAYGDDAWRGQAGISQRAEQASFPAGLPLANLEVSNPSWCDDELEATGELVAWLPVQNTGEWYVSAETSFQVRGAEELPWWTEHVYNTQAFDPPAPPVFQQQVFVDLAPGEGAWLEIRLPPDMPWPVLAAGVGLGDTGYDFDECDYRDNWVRPE